MAGLGKKKEQRRAKREAKKKAANASSASASASASSSSSPPSSPRHENVISLPAEEFYDNMFGHLESIPVLGNAMGGIIRNLMRMTVPRFTDRFSDLPCLLGNNLVWLQLLLVDERKLTNTKMYALGSRVAVAEDDSDVIERSRKLFKDCVPYLLEKTSLWIFTRSLVRREYTGCMDDDARKFSDYDPLGNLLQLPEDKPSNICMSEIFLFFAGKFEMPGDLVNRDALLHFLNGLNSKEGIKKLHGFYVTSAQAKATREKVNELNGKHEAV